MLFTAFLGFGLWPGRSVFHTQQMTLLVHLQTLFRLPPPPWSRAGPFSPGLLQKHPSPFPSLCLGLTAVTPSHRGQGHLLNMKHQSLVLKAPRTSSPQLPITFTARESKRPLPGPMSSVPISQDRPPTSFAPATPGSTLLRAGQAHAVSQSKMLWIFDFLLSFFLKSQHLRDAFHVLQGPWYLESLIAWPLIFHHPLLYFLRRSHHLG